MFFPQISSLNNINIDSYVIITNLPESQDHDINNILRLFNMTS